LSRYILVVLSVSVVLTALVIVALNAYVTNRQLAQNGDSSFIDKAFSTFSYDDGYKDGYNAAREKFNLRSDGIMSAVGTVQKVEADSVTIKAINLDTDEFVDGVSDIRQVFLTASTTLSLRKTLTEDELNKAMAAWRNAPGNDPPPLPFSESKATINDIVVGSEIIVNVETNIRLEESFEASQIIILSQPQPVTLEE